MASFARKNIRLPGYDYSEIGAYFITMCTHNKENIFWEDNGWRPNQPNDSPPLSKLGRLVDTAVQSIPKHYDHVSVQKYSILPNHIHLILVISIENENSGLIPSVSTIIKQLKGYVTKTSGNQVWQKSFYDRIIRNDQEYQNIWAYIDSNPINWEADK
jgi:REP element-mobilizing transposase RayT